MTTDDRSTKDTAGADHGARTREKDWKEKRDRLLGLKYECTWKAKDWRAEESGVIASSLIGEDGALSGTARLVLGPGDLVAEVYFPANSRPKVVAVYEPRPEADES